MLGMAKLFPRNAILPDITQIEWGKFRMLRRSDANFVSWCYKLFFLDTQGYKYKTIVCVEPEVVMTVEQLRELHMYTDVPYHLSDN